jgi:hypothetical protein
MQLTDDQKAALQLFRELDDSTAPLTAVQVAVLQHLTTEVIAFDETERLKQFARDTAAINPRLLADVESGHIRPCRMLSELMDSFYGVQA